MKKVLQLAMALVLATITFVACDKEEELIQDELTTNSTAISNQRAYFAPWVYVMDWRFSRGTCATGPGVCFQDGDGDILDYTWLNVNGGGTYTELAENFEKFTANDDDLDNGPMAFRIENRRLHIAFSRSLEETSLRIDRDVELPQALAAYLGKSSITIPAGSYEVDYANLKHGEAYVPFTAEEIKYDYHPRYGQISKEAYPVGGEVTLDRFLRELDLSVNDLREYQVVEAKFTGTALAEHNIDGETIYVWHKYEGEPVALFEGVRQDGVPVTAQRIHFCGNGFGGYNSFDFFWAFIDFGCWWCD